MAAKTALTAVGLGDWERLIIGTVHGRLVQQLADRVCIGAAAHAHGVVVVAALDQQQLFGVLRGGEEFFAEARRHILISRAMDQ